ncbi:uncharacterized protein LOC118767567 [Octopus sinensis]|uniref:Uncharacterized protein LOC118767567 n=1 Tax=Octopus sinensis TaxID=2607531 RepID=A0A7E6FKT7_9MOLL|nr:uncharacterized protein LOC118767567 [Octopus sinensis]XP_036368229.1 uncharacterized protein LOC118767567 [Octopus sinensis]
MIVHLSSAKHSHDLVVPIDKRCNVLFSTNIEEFDHIIWWKGLLIQEIFICCHTFTVQVRKNTERSLLDDTINGLTDKKTLRRLSVEQARQQQQQEDKEDDGILYTTDTLLTREQIEETGAILFKHSRKKISNVVLGMYVMKLLYCYILPRLLITLEDLPFLKALQQLINKEYFVIQKEIMDNDCKILQTTNELAKKREILCSFTEPHQDSFFAAIDKSFLETLRSHFINDLSYMEEHYMASQMQIKESKNNSDKRNTLYFEQMESQRIIERTQRWKKILTKINHRLREPLKQSKRKSIKLENNILELCDYSKIFQDVKECKMKMKMDCFYKIKILAIGELIKTSVYEVETFCESLGTSNKRNTISSFLVTYDHDVSSHWQTCEEKILIVLTNHNEIRQKHLDFISEINGKVSLSLSDDTIFRLADTDRFDVKSCDIVGQAENLAGRFGPGEESSFPQPFSELTELTFMQLKERISEHVYQMHEELITISELEKSEQKMIFVIYEDLLFNEIMEDLYKLSKIACKSYCRCIWEKVSTLPFSSLPISEVFTKIEKRMSRLSRYHRSKSIFDFQNSFPSLSFESALKSKSVSTLYKVADIDEQCQMLQTLDLETKPTSKRNSSVYVRRDTITLEEFCEHFKPALMNIKEILKSPTILSKLHAIQLSVKCISNCILDNQKRPATADDIITSLCGLLKSLNKEQFQTLCYQLALVDIFIPQSHRIGPYGNSLIHFNCSLQALYIESCNEIRHHAQF